MHSEKQHKLGIKQEFCQQDYHSLLALSKQLETLSHFVFLSFHLIHLFIKGIISDFLCFYDAIVMYFLFRKTQNYSTDCQNSFARFQNLSVYLSYLIYLKEYLNYNSMLICSSKKQVVFSAELAKKRHVFKFIIN